MIYKLKTINTMKKIAIKGHLTRGEDIIKILESLGGINETDLKGTQPEVYYYLKDNYIRCRPYSVIFNEYDCYTLEEYEQKFNNMGIKRNIQIDLTTAKEWYNKGGQLKEIALQAFSENELQELPKSWEEYCKINPYLTKDKEFFLAPDGTVTNIDRNCYRRVDFTLSMASKKRAEQFVTLSKLIQIRDYYNQGWKPDWTNNKEEKYIIGYSNNRLFLDTFLNLSHIFAFKTKTLRDEFFENFKEELEKIKEFL